MKKIILLLAIVSASQIAKAQNVGIGTTTPNNQLQIGNVPGFTGNHLAIGNGVQGMSFNQSSITSIWYSNTGFSLMPNGGNGYVGIGTAAPAYNLDVFGTGNAQFNLKEGIGSQTALFSRYTNRLEIQPSDAFQISVGGIDQRNLCIANNGYTGIGTSTPSTRLQVFTADASYGITHTNGTVSVGTYVGSGGGWLGTQSNHPLYFFTNNSNALMALGTNGYFGIGTITPANKLQIGSVGSSGYGGNDIAFGNGTQASGITQTGSVAQWYSTTDIALMPKGNGHGRVGINTLTPSVPLEVDDYVTLPADIYWYWKSHAVCSTCPPDIQLGTISPQASILAQSNVVAIEFDVFSDSRIKDIEDVSKSSNDLETLNKIEVTNYTLKDKIKNGDKTFKKVIAQQVEAVYPQVVSKHVDFIPNVYQLTDKIIKTDSGYIITFENGHHLSKDAKRIKLLAPGDNTMKQYNIVTILSDKEVLINAPDLNGDKVFVYGEEVNDFRTVDYEGLTTLNISATQELSKLLQQQQKEIDELKAEIILLKKK